MIAMNVCMPFTPDRRSIRAFFKSEQPNSMTWCKKKRELSLVLRIARQSPIQVLTLHNFIDQTRGYMSVDNLDLGNVC